MIGDGPNKTGASEEDLDAEFAGFEMRHRFSIPVTFGLGEEKHASSKRIHDPLGKTESHG